VSADGIEPGAMLLMLHVDGTTERGAKVHNAGTGDNT
jgi:hypothetical protein